MRNENSSSHPAADRVEFDRNAFNAAFSELGLCWHWDEQTYAELQAIAAEGDRLRRYLETQQRHLLKAYDADFLIDAIRETKTRVCGELPGAPRTQ
ncbi:hypothetical protein SBBP1_1070005 [Burkholderiales bacterium]|nr:hypothetical protein SBBP1_1070005 [Burkholderiales bacterium]